MAEKTIVEKAAEAVGYGIAMAEDVAGSVKTAVGAAVTTVTEVLTKTPSKKATIKKTAQKAPAKKAVAKKAVQKTPAKKAAKKVVVKKAVAKKAASAEPRCRVLSRIREPHSRRLPRSDFPRCSARSNQDRAGLQLQLKVQRPALPRRPLKARCRTTKSAYMIKKEWL